MKIKISKKPINVLWRILIRIGSSTLSQFIVLFIVLIGINVLSQRFFFRVDLTQNNIYTLSSGSKNIIRGIDGNITIKTYFSENMPPDVLPVAQDAKDLFEEYERYSDGKVTFEVVNPTNEDFKTKAEEAGVPEIQFSEYSSDKFEIAQGFLGAAIYYNETTEAIPLITNVSNLEYEVSSRIYKLTTEDKGKVGFLTGHGEKNIYADYSQINQVLSRQFTVDAIDLSDGKPINPEEFKVLIIAAPTGALPNRDLFEIDQYIMRGGRVIFLTDLYTLDYQAPTLTKTDSNLNDLLNNYGVEVKSSVLLDESFLPLPSGYTQITYPYWVRTLRENMYTENPALFNLESLVFFWTNPLTEFEIGDNRTFTKLIQTTEKAWEKVGADTISVDFEQFTPIGQQQYTIAALVEGKQESKFTEQKIPGLEDKETEDLRTKDDPRVDSTEDAKIVVIGDSEFISDSLISGSEQNPTFFLNMVEWLSSSKDLLEIRSKNVTQRPLDITEEGERIFVKIINVGLVPVILVGFGIGYNIFRKRKQSAI